LIVNRRFAIAGALASMCAPVLAQQSLYELSLVSLDGTRKVLGTLPDAVFAPRVSPDGRSVALELRDPVRGAVPEIQERVWIAELDRLKRRRALPAVGRGRNWAPLWSRDGRRIVFLVSDAGKDSLWWRNTDGTGEPEHLVDALSAEGMTPDGASLTYITLTGDRDYDISMLDLATKATHVVVHRPRSEQHSSTVSPDGRWIAYASNEAGRHDIWLEALGVSPRPTTTSVSRHRLTTGGGSHPLWAPDGRHLYFDRDGQLFSLALTFTDKGPRADAPVELPIRGFQQGYRRRQFDLMPDGEQFLMLFPRGYRP
jgi:Tol biopolymer transport system component